MSLLYLLLSKPHKFDELVNEVTDVTHLTL